MLHMLFDSEAVEKNASPSWDSLGSEFAIFK